ncbi:hypothetical protein OSB04_un001664 [Centaurea solstitialis]|uniref:Uncharacterized protein n=1 Tax=Centaurea solstitialis TaxID=347529 RepID=A0AA38S1R1_9ASTR|nr:hypothetical protein OSB04_un001664 [Centaurea solstitialis]
MSVFVVALILLKTKRTVNSNHLCVGETVSYFVPKLFYKAQAETENWEFPIVMHDYLTRGIHCKYNLAH